MLRLLLWTLHLLPPKGRPVSAGSTRKHGLKVSGVIGVILVDPRSSQRLGIRALTVHAAEPNCKMVTQWRTKNAQI